MMNRGDDLDDDFVLDELVALSDGEGAGDTHLEDEDVFVDDQGSEDEVVPDTVSTKKRKQREKEKEKKRKRRKESVDVARTFVASHSPHQLAEYISGIQSKSFSKLSEIELEDLRIPASSIIDTTSWTGPRTLDKLVDFIVEMLPDLQAALSQPSKSNGAPALMYVAAAALRVADVVRILRDQKLRGKAGGDVAKLFAKHFKLAQHVTYLKQTDVKMAVGTPGRLGKLLSETDALRVASMTHIILDVSHKDVKNRNLLEVPETRDETMQMVLNNRWILKRIKEGKIQIVLF